MKIEIDTNTDSYEMWQKIQILIETAYIKPPVQPLTPKPGGKEEGAPLSLVW